MPSIRFIALILTVLILMSGAFLAGVSVSQEQADEPQEQENPYEAMMQPGPMHELLARSAGEWNIRQLIWEMPGAEPIETTGTTTREMVMNGHYLCERGTLASDQYGEYNVVTYLGFNNWSQEFESIVIAGMDTGMYWHAGSYDEEAETITMHGQWKMVDPSNGQEMVVPSRVVVSWPDENTELTELYYCFPGHEEMRVGEFTATRVGTETPEDEEQD